MPLPKICCPWGSGAFWPVLVGTGDRYEGLQLSCLLRGCSAHPAGASVADGLCLTRALDAASKVTEQEWREKAKKDLEEWNLRQNEQMEKNRANNRYVGVSMAKRTVCLPGMFESLFPHCGVQPCRDRTLPSKGRDPRSWSGSGGCAEPLWLEPHWDHPGILVPPALQGASRGAGLGFRFSWCAEVCGSLFGRTNPLCSLFLTLCLPVAPLHSLSLCARG